MVTNETRPRQPTAGAPKAFSWIPIRSLAPRHRPRILVHLLALPPADRYLRFGHAASDAQITHYVDLLDFERDEVFGIFNRRLDLIAMAHLAYMGPEAAARGAEFGVSVLPRARGRGLGGRLFDRAVLHARNRKVDTLIIHALSENAAMLRIVRAAGATIERDGPESQAVLKLPAETLGSHVEALLARQAAEFDYTWKQNARRVDGLLEMIADVREGVGSSGAGPGSQ